MSVNAKRIFLHISKSFGLFRLTRLFARPGLRILCYHGFAIGDEAEFRPKLFIRPETFEQRLRFLTKEGFSILRWTRGSTCYRAVASPRAQRRSPSMTGFTAFTGWLCPRFGDFL